MYAITKYLAGMGVSFTRILFLKTVPGITRHNVVDIC